jgi:hypothetical protein
MLFNKHSRTKCLNLIIEILINYKGWCKIAKN